MSHSLRTQPARKVLGRNNIQALAVVIRRSQRQQALPDIDAAVAAVKRRVGEGAAVGFREQVAAGLVDKAVAGGAGEATQDRIAFTAGAHRPVYEFKCSGNNAYQHGDQTEQNLVHTVIACSHSAMHALDLYLSFCKASGENCL